jgi:hypothetical protein
MGVDHSFGLSGGPRSKDDLQSVIFAEIRDWLKQRLPRECRLKVLEGDQWDAVPQSAQLLLAARHEPGADLRDHSSNKVHRAACIERHGHYAAQDTTEKRADPVASAGAPNHNALALCDASRFEAMAETSRQPRKFSVGSPLKAKTAGFNYRRLVSTPFHIANQRRQMWPVGWLRHG